MQITDVKVFLVGEEKLKAFVSLVLDGCFMINDIKVIQGRDGLFISMPSRKKRNGQFKDVAHPLNQETRNWMEDEILEEYQRCLDGPEGERDADPESEEPTERPPRREEPVASEPTGRAHRVVDEAARVPVAAASGGEGEPKGSRSAVGERSAELEIDDDASLDEVQRRHLSDSFWSVS